MHFGNFFSGGGGQFLFMALYGTMASWLAKLHTDATKTIARQHNETTQVIANGFMNLASTVLQMQASKADRWAVQRGGMPQGAVGSLINDFAGQGDVTPIAPSGPEPSAVNATPSPQPSPQPSASPAPFVAQPFVGNAAGAP